MLYSLPATNHTVSEKTLKLMLLSLKKNLQSDPHSQLSQFKVQMEKLEKRTDHIERKINQIILKKTVPHVQFTYLVSMSK